jgi:hypothetical protein
MYQIKRVNIGNSPQLDEAEAGTFPEAQREGAGL